MELSKNSTKQFEACPVPNNASFAREDVFKAVIIKYDSAK
jgi:hypothetical protein